LRKGQGRILAFRPGGAVAARTSPEWKRLTHARRRRNFLRTRGRISAGLERF